MNNLSTGCTILVTGAGGGLGKAVTAALKNKGYENILTPSRQALDLLDGKAVNSYFAVNRPQIVIHLASVVFGLQGNLENQMKSLSENTQINESVFGAINEYPVEYVFFAGTVAAYAYPYVTIPLIEEEFFDGLPHGGEFGYAMSKRHAYAYLDVLKETKGIHYNYGIFTNLYGENDRFNEGTGHVIPSLIMKAHQAASLNQPFSIWGDGKAERDFLHFDDAAAAVIKCMETPQAPSLINISSGKISTIRMVAESIAKAAGVTDIQFQTDKPVGIKSRVVDNTKLANIGFIQTVSLEDGIERLYQWYTTNVLEARS